MPNGLEALGREPDDLLRRLHEECAARLLAEDRLQVKELELHDARLSLESRVAERTDELRQATRHRARLMASIAHEIRTPLNGVVGLSQLMLDEPLPESQRRRAEVLVQSARDLKLTLDDVLDLSKIEENQLRLDPQPTRIREVADHVVELFRASAESKGLYVRASCDGCDSVVLADAFRLRQVLSNLVANALKFTESGGAILRIIAEGASSEGLRIRFTLRDTGIGIPEDRQASIFEPFAQATEGTAAQYGGTGLGLSIVRALVRLMGDDVTLVSAPGRGSEFSFVLDFLYAPREEPGAKPRRTLHRGLKVAVVDDNAVNLMVAEAMLRSLGCEVVVYDGAEKMLAATDGSEDLVVTDIRMPGMDGCGLTRALRERGYTNPILALTAGTTSEERGECMDAGMQAIVAKPLDRQELTDAIERYVLRPDA